MTVPTAPDAVLQQAVPVNATDTAPGELPSTGTSTGAMIAGGSVHSAIRPAALLQAEQGSTGKDTPTTPSFSEQFRNALAATASVVEPETQSPDARVTTEPVEQLPPEVGIADIETVAPLQVSGLEEPANPSALPSALLGVNADSDTPLQDALPNTVQALTAAPASALDSEGVPIVASVVAPVVAGQSQISSEVLTSRSPEESTQPLVRTQPTVTPGPPGLLDPMAQARVTVPANPAPNLSNESNPAGLVPANVATPSAAQLRLSDSELGNVQLATGTSVNTAAVEEPKPAAPTTPIMPISAPLVQQSTSRATASSLESKREVSVSASPMTAKPLSDPAANTATLQKANTDFADLAMEPLRPLAAKPQASQSAAGVIPVPLLTPASAEAFTPANVAAVTNSVSLINVNALAVTETLVPADRTTDLATGQLRTLSLTQDSQLGDKLGALLASVQQLGRDKLSIQLQPQELGRLEVRIASGAEQSLSISISAQHSSTRDLIESQLHRLRGALGEQGFMNIDLDVEQDDAGRDDRRFTQQNGQEMNQSHPGFRPGMPGTEQTGKVESTNTESEAVRTHRFALLGAADSGVDAYV